MEEMAAGHLTEELWLYLSPPYAGFCCSCTCHCTVCLCLCRSPVGIWSEACVSLLTWLDALCPRRTMKSLPRMQQLAGQATGQGDRRLLCDHLTLDSQRLFFPSQYQIMEFCLYSSDFFHYSFTLLLP